MNLKKEMALLQKKIMMETVSCYSELKKSINVSIEIFYLLKYVLTLI